MQESTKVAFLDVGQGDAAVLVLPDSSSVVIDCPSGKAQVVIDYLGTEGITNLSHVFLTHTDEDHFGGVVNLLENFQQIGELGIVAYNLDTPKVGGGKRKAVLQKLVQLARRDGLKVVKPTTGMQWVVKDIVVDILHPDPLDLDQAQLRGNPNDASVVLRLTLDKYRVLLTGDIQAQGWHWITERSTDLQADIFKFPHHGAWYEPNGGQPSLEEILRQINPSVTILSVGSNNRYGHPHSNTIELLCSSDSIEFAHTQPTGRCYSVVETKRGPFSCSGTVEAIIDKTGMDIVGESKISIN